MSGLERLRKLAGNYSYAINTYNVLTDIADEIERDFKVATKGFNYYDTLFNKAKLLGKPFREDEPIDIDNWLDRWYLPRPVIDGEPVQFGDEFEATKDGKLTSLPVSGFYIFNDRPNQLFIETSKNCAYTPYVENAKRVKPDSIENLRDEIYDVVSDVYAIGTHEIVDEWLKRAEKLFKDGDE